MTIKWNGTVNTAVIITGSSTEREESKLAPVYRSLSRSPSVLQHIYNERTKFYMSPLITTVYKGKTPPAWVPWRLFAKFTWYLSLWHRLRPSLKVLPTNKVCIFRRERIHNEGEKRMVLLYIKCTEEAEPWNFNAAWLCLYFFKSFTFWENRCRTEC